MDFNSAYDGAANSLAAAHSRSAVSCAPARFALAAGREGDDRGDPSAEAAPTAYRGAATDYGGIYGGSASFARRRMACFLYDRAVKFADITDGTSHTLAIAEDTGRGWLHGWRMDQWREHLRCEQPDQHAAAQRDLERSPGRRDGAVVRRQRVAAGGDDGLPVLRSICTRAGNDANGNY